MRRGDWRHVYGADFETDNDGAGAWICQFAISSGTGEYWGHTLQEF